MTTDAHRPPAHRPPAHRRRAHERPGDAPGLLEGTDSPASKRQSRLRSTRRITPGQRRALKPGSTLRCLVLAPGPAEWAGVDIESGAFVRLPPPDEEALAEAPGEWVTYDVVEMVLGQDDEPLDPARPEAVQPARPPLKIGRLRRGARRRLLSQVATPERPGSALLGIWGPSIALSELEGSRPSIVLVGVSPGSLELGLDGDGATLCAFDWGAARHVLPVIDRRCHAIARANPGQLQTRGLIEEAFGSKVVYLVVGLGSVRAGHAPKTVLAVLRR